MPVQESQDALPAGFGGRPKPAVGADALEAFGQNMLEKTAEELVGGHREGALLLVGAVFVFKGNLSAFIAEDALVPECGA